VGGVWLIATIGLLCLISEFDPVAEYQEVLLLGRGEETGTSLTGRLPLWEDLSAYISLRPSKGYGYRAVWTPRHIYDIAVSQEWVISEAHSTYIDATLQLGVVGAATLLFTELTTFLYAALYFRKTQQPAYLFLVGGVFFCIVRGFTESGLGDPTGVTPFLFLTMAAHTWNGKRKLIDKTNTANHHQPIPL